MQPTLRFRSILSPILFAVLIGFDMTPALAASPKETPSTSLARTFKTPPSQTLNLSKNLYRQEAYEDYYEEQVPYYEEETYYESVPYEVDEAYDDVEYYYETEQVCRQVPYEERVCKQEQECTQPRKEQRCQTERVCGPGHHGTFQLLKLILPSAEARRDRAGGGGPGDDNGNDDRERQERERRDNEERQRRDGEERDRRDREERERNRCRDIRKCEDVVIDPGNCRQVEKCHNKTKHRRECNLEQIQKSRTVTKYRRVTRYRDEARTRTVTRYRSETRCCVTRYRDVFDRQWATSVTINFPAAATLTAREIEKFKISLVGDETSPQVKIVPVDAVYAYEPFVVSATPEQIVVDMTLKPKYTAKELGTGSLESLGLIDDAGANFLIVKDKGTRNKITTQYTAQVADAKTGDVLGRVQWTVDGEKKFHELQLGAKLKVGAAVKITVNIQRVGIVLDKPVDFTSPDTAAKVTKAVSYETKTFVDANQVGKLVISGKLAGAVLSFVDGTKNNAEVVSQYDIRLRDAAGNDLGGALIARKDLKAGANGRYNVSIADELGLAEESLAKLASGAKITVELKVLRHGRKFKPNPFTFEKKLTVTLH